MPFDEPCTQCRLPWSKSDRPVKPSSTICTESPTKAQKQVTIPRNKIDARKVKLINALHIHDKDQDEVEIRPAQCQAKPGRTS